MLCVVMPKWLATNEKLSLKKEGFLV